VLGNQIEVLLPDRVVEAFALHQTNTGFLIARNWETEKEPLCCSRA
jgi:hypothetical protein